MKRSIESNQRKVVVLAFSFDMVSNANTIAGLDKLQVSLNTDHGTGDISIDLDEALQDMVPVVTTETADSVAQVSVTDSNTIRIKTFDSTDGTTAKDAKVHVVIVGSRVSDRY